MVMAKEVVLIPRKGIGIAQPLVVRVAALVAGGAARRQVAG